MSSIAALLSLADESKTSDLSAAALLAKLIPVIESIDDAEITTALPPNSPERYELPLARLWTHKVRLAEDELWPRAAEAIELTAERCGIDNTALHTVYGDDPFNGTTVIETLANALIDTEQTAVLKPLWVDSFVPGRATKGIFQLCVELESFLIFLGSNAVGQSRLIVLGFQPYEAELFPAPEHVTQEVPDTLEGEGQLIEAFDLPHPSWWKALVDRGDATLARATFLQMATPNVHIDVTTPDQAPRWVGVELHPHATA